MNRILLTGMLCVILSTIVDAAPRGRRARRRAALQQQQRTTQYYRSSNGRYYYNRSTTATNSTRTYARPQVTYTRPKTTPSASVASTTVQNAVTAYKPVLPTQSTPQPSPTPLALAKVSPIATTTGDASEADAAVSSISTAASSEVIQAAAIEPIPDLMPQLKSASHTTTQPYCASCQVIPAGKSFSSAMAELNSIRASRGLPALVEDPKLSALAHQKASMQANAGAMFHPGGTLGGARFEGVGMGPRFTTCYQDATNVRYAGAATVTGANGQRYHCLLVR